MQKADSYNFTNNRKYKFVLAIVSSLFSFFFLLFFQPFGINNYRPDEKITLIFAVAIFVFAFLIFSGFLFCEFFLKSKLVTKKGIVSLALWLFFEIIFICSISFLFYNYSGNFHDFYWSSYVKHIFEMGSILILPMVGTLFYFKYSTVVKNYEQILSVSKENTKLDEIVLVSGEYKKDQIALNLNNIVFIQSEDNYASLNYIENNQIKRYLIRSTLTSLEKKLNSEYIVRCNRSTIVNLVHLESSKQVANKLTLILKGVTKVFEVSKPNQNKLAGLIKKLSE